MYSGLADLRDTVRRFHRFIILELWIQSITIGSQSPSAFNGFFLPQYSVPYTDHQIPVDLPSSAHKRVYAVRFHH